MNQNHRSKTRSSPMWAAIGASSLFAALLGGCGGGGSDPAAPAPLAVAPPDAVEVIVGQQSALAAADSSEPTVLTVLSTPGNETSEPKTVQ